MNCDQFAVVAHELARPESLAGKSLDGAVRQAASAHAQECPNCAARLSEAQLLALALDAVSEDSQLLEPSAHLEPRLLSAFREHHRAQERSQQRTRQIRMRWLEWAALAATAAVLFAAGAWNFSHRSPGNSANSHATAGSASSGSVTGPSSSGMETADAQINSDDEFVAVPYSGAGTGSEQSGVVVRVQMPRSALADLGYPVDVTQSADLVEADVLVGYDGWPRAVRVVQ